MRAVLVVKRAPRFYCIQRTIFREKPPLCNLESRSSTTDITVEEFIMEASLIQKNATETTTPPLWTKGFIALLITQFMVALNDNIFRWLIIPIGKWAIGWTDKTDQIRMIGSLAFVLPFMLLASYAGYACDRYNRRYVLIWCKIAELIIMLVGTAAILSRSVPFMLVTLFLMASQSTFFSPAKYGSLPNLVAKERISEANGYFSMTTMIACIGGTGIGGILFALTTLNHEAPTPGEGGMYHWQIWSATIVGVAIVGLISSLFIPSIKAADPNAKFPINPFSQTCKDLLFLFRQRFLFWIAILSAFFWGLGALAQVNIDKFATEYLHVSQEYVAVLVVSLSLGLALGALLAGRLSRGKIELGLVPIGALFIVSFCTLLFFTPQVTPSASDETVVSTLDGVPSQNVATDDAAPQPTSSDAVSSPITFGFIFGAISLFLLGISAGLYDVPLLATLQMKSPPEFRCRILAAYNFCSFAAMAIFSLLQGVLAAPPIHGVGGQKIGLSATQIWLFCAFISVPVLVYSYRAFPLPFKNAAKGETQVD